MAKVILKRGEKLEARVYEHATDRAAFGRVEALCALHALASGGCELRRDGADYVVDAAAWYDKK